jgi:hypothetical protein
MMDEAVPDDSEGEEAVIDTDSPGEESGDGSGDMAG